jgi:hypothetical protein
MRVNRRKHECRCRPVAEQLVDESAGDLVRMICVCESSLFGIRIPTQPVEQLLAIGCNDVELRVMIPPLKSSTTTVSASPGRSFAAGPTPTTAPSSTTSRPSSKNSLADDDACSPGSSRQ